MTGVDEGDFAVRRGDYEIGNAQLALQRHFVRRRSQRREAAEDIESAYRFSQSQHIGLVSVSIQVQLAILSAGDRNEVKLWRTQSQHIGLVRVSIQVQFVSACQHIGLVELRLTRTAYGLVRVSIQLQIVSPCRFSQFRHIFYFVSAYCQHIGLVCVSIQVQLAILSAGDRSEVKHQCEDTYIVA